MKAIIIEDEIHQQELLLEMLNKHFHAIDCVGVATNVESGLSLINSVQPDLIFLDVILASGTCFDLLQKLDTREFDIIFTTSYEEYAVRAFRLAAIDYLLKPIALDELKTAISKLHAHRTARETFDHIKVLLSNINGDSRDEPRIALPTLTGFTLVAIDDIVRCESDNTYTTFYLKNNRHILISKTLKSCEKILTDYSFFRVHNSSLINLKYIKEYIKGEGGIIIMQDGKEVNVSRRRKEAFLRHFRSMRL